MAAGDIARWTGAAADGNWSTAGNWTALTGSPSTPPASDEVAYFDHRSGTNSNVTAGLDQSAVDLYKMIVREGFSGTIGGSGGALLVSISNTSTASDPMLEWSSKNGTIYIGGSGETIDEIQANGAGRMILVHGTVTELVAEPVARVEVQSDVTLTTAYVKSANVADNGTANGTTLVAVDGARVTTKRQWTTLTNDAASTYIDNDKAITTLNLHGKGTHTHNSTGTITNANRFNGTLAADQEDFTITNDTGYVGKSTIVQKPGGGKVTVTNDLAIGDTTSTL